MAARGEQLNWEGLLAALVELMGAHVNVDVRVQGTPIPVAGLSGEVVTGGFGYEEGNLLDEKSTYLRVRSPGSTEFSYVHILRSWFEGANWATLNGRRSLSVRFRGLDAMVVMDDES